MVDLLTPEERSERMSRIRSKDTVPEKQLRRALHRRGLRFRLNVGTLPGRPDIVLPRFKTAVFVHGCFWHRHEGCKVASTPKSNTAFWTEKFGRNVERDRRNAALLRRLGWKVRVVWECQVNSERKIDVTADKLARQIRASVRADT